MKVKICVDFLSFSAKTKHALNTYVVTLMLTLISTAVKNAQSGFIYRKNRI